MSSGCHKNFFNIPGFRRHFIQKPGAEVDILPYLHNKGLPLLCYVLNLPAPFERIDIIGFGCPALINHLYMSTACHLFVEISIKKADSTLSVLCPPIN